ncbi:MAG TPA: GNAT family N-acetyltransferase [Myxococcaceae bacterium]|nr:GNAT family N-acetyltransferase [Myxococcaceae bacterium]
MNLNQVTVPLIDHAATVAFYRALGLTLIVDSPPDYARFECPNGATFSVHRGPHPVSRATVVYFECDDLDDRVRALEEKGLVFEQRPRDERWLWREVRLLDPAGNEICLFRAGENRRFPAWRVKGQMPAPPSGILTGEEVSVRRVGASEAAALVEPLADVLIDCVDGGASVSFMAPLSREKAVAFWRHVADSVAKGERVLLIAQDGAGRVLGTVQLILSLPENQPHRADVAKMLVHSEARRRGIAQRLLDAVDEEARKEGRTVLVLDAVTGGDAERLYERAGWRRVGVIPKYALMPNGDFCATTFFYKHL